MIPLILYSSHQSRIGLTIDKIHIISVWTISDRCVIRKICSKDLLNYLSSMVVFTIRYTFVSKAAKLRDHGITFLTLLRRRHHKLYRKFVASEARFAKLIDETSAGERETGRRDGCGEEDGVGNWDRIAIEIQRDGGLFILEFLGLMSMQGPSPWHSLDIEVCRLGG